MRGWSHIHTQDFYPGKRLQIPFDIKSPQSFLEVQQTGSVPTVNLTKHCPSFPKPEHKNVKMKREVQGPHMRKGIFLHKERLGDAKVYFAEMNKI